MSDVLLVQTNDGGDITIENGVAELAGGLETSVYLSLFGGNEDDDGRADNDKNWWGNIDEIDPAMQYHSKTQNLLQALPATTGNLRRVEVAARDDLSWFIEKKVASSVVVIASLPGIDQIRIEIDIEARGEKSRFEFTENWISRS